MDMVAIGVDAHKHSHTTVRPGWTSLGGAHRGGHAGRPSRAGALGVCQVAAKEVLPESPEHFAQRIAELLKHFAPGRPTSRARGLTVTAGS